MHQVGTALIGCGKVVTATGCVGAFNCANRFGL